MMDVDHLSAQEQDGSTSILIHSFKLQTKVWIWSRHRLIQIVLRKYGKESFSLMSSDQTFFYNSVCHIIGLNSPLSMNEFCQYTHFSLVSHRYELPSPVEISIVTLVFMLGSIPAPGNPQLKDSWWILLIFVFKNGSRSEFLFPIQSKMKTVSKSTFYSVVQL